MYEGFVGEKRVWNSARVLSVQGFASRAETVVAVSVWRVPGDDGSTAGGASSRVSFADSNGSAAAAGSIPEATLLLLEAAPAGRVCEALDAKKLSC